MCNDLKLLPGEPPYHSQGELQKFTIKSYCLRQSINLKLDSQCDHPIGNAIYYGHACQNQAGQTLR